VGTVEQSQQCRLHHSILALLRGVVVATYPEAFQKLFLSR
jgi:hypothetical protein